MRRLAAVVTIAVACATASATTSPPTRAQESTPRLVVVDTSFSFAVGEVLRFDVRLEGIDPEALELTDAAPPDTAPPVPGSTVPDGSVPSPVETPDPPVGLTVEVTNYRPLTDPDDAAALVGADVDPAAFDAVLDGVAIDLREVVTLEGGDAVFTLEIGTDVAPSVQDRLRFDEPGIHPIRIELLLGDPDDDDVLATAGTVVERRRSRDDPGATFAAVAPPLDLAVVAAIESPPLDADDTEIADAALLAAIDGASALDAPMTLVAPPQVVASVVDGASDPVALRESITEDEFVSLPIIPLDVSAAAAVGRGDQYARLVNAGEDLLADTVPETPTRREVWIAVDTLTTAGAQHLRNLGARYVAMPAELYRESIDPALPEPGLFVEAPLPDGADMPILVIDTLDGALDADTADAILSSMTPTDWATATLAELLIEQINADLLLARPAQRSRVLAAPDLAAPDTRLLSRLERLAESTPSVGFVAASTLGRLTDTAERQGDPVTVTLPETPDVSLVERLERIEATALTIASAGSMLPDDDPRREGWQAELDELISTGYTDDDVGDRIDELLAEAETLTGAVGLPEPFTFTLTGRSGIIEVRLTNTSDESLRVLLDLASTKLAFPEGVQEVTLRPEGETTVDVPVQARSNGTASVTVTVSTPLGEPLDEPVVLTSRVTALTGLGQVLTGGFVLVLVAWWFAHWRNRRRDELSDDGRSRHPSSRAASADDEVASDAL